MRAIGPCTAPVNRACALVAACTAIAAELAHRLRDFVWVLVCVCSRSYSMGADRLRDGPDDHIRSALEPLLRKVRST